MLHQDPLMTEMDVNHWRNLQSLVLESAKAKRRIIVIHEDGAVQKCVHSHGDEVTGRIERVDNAHAAAEALYRANQSKVDFVAVFERKAFDSYFGAFQDTWRADEDLDTFVHRSYAMLDEYPDGMVTFPGRARETLGLQWRTGASYEQITDAVARFVEPNSSVVLGVFEGGEIWASLVLGFDVERKANVVTTVDSMVVPLSGEWARVAGSVKGWVDGKFTGQPCRLGLYTDLEGARELLAASDKLAVLRQLKPAGRLLADPLPEALAAALG
jgi:hypothetical protein